MLFHLRSQIRMTLRLARLWLTTGLFAAVPALFGQSPGPAPSRANPPSQVQPAKAAPVPIQFAPHPGGDMVDSFKLADGDIDAILAALETYTGRTILRPGTLPTQTYSLKITRPIPKAELVTALETILELGNVSVSPMGDRLPQGDEPQPGEERGSRDDHWARPSTCRRAARS